MPDSPEDTYPAVNESNGEIDFNISYPTGTAAQNLGYYMNKLNSYQLPIGEDWPWEDALGNDRNKNKNICCKLWEYFSSHGLDEYIICIYNR